MSVDAQIESDIRSLLESVAGRGRSSCGEHLKTVLGYIQSRSVTMDTIVDFLCLCFRESETVIIGDTLTHLFPDLAGIEIEFLDSVPSPHLIGIRKGESLSLFFPRAITSSPGIRVKVLLLIWFLPQLEHAVKIDSHARGFTWLSQWDVGVWNGLAYSSASPDHLLIPDTMFIPSKGYRQYRKRLAESFVPWEERLSVCFWRGSTTGQRPWGSSWAALPRIQLANAVRESGALFDVGISKISQIQDETAREEIKTAGLLKKYVSSHLQQKWKYLVDIDGNSNAWSGLFEKLLTGSTVLKITSPHRYRQWYYHKMVAWEHYVPVASDFNDLESKVRLLEKKDGLAERIGEAGRILAESLTFESQLEVGALTINRAMRIFEEQ
jgi:hypothetical protein